MDNNDQILTEFLIEAQEIFDQLDLDFVQLEQTPDDKKLVGNIFRAMHTLKGSSGFFAFHRLEKVAHAGESLLSKIRDGALILNADMTDALLETSDRLREIVAGIEKSRIESVGDDSNLIANLKSLTEGGPPFIPSLMQMIAQQILRLFKPLFKKRHLKRKLSPKKLKYLFQNYRLLSSIQILPMFPQVIMLSLEKLLLP